ncbi:DsrE/DsrF/DrsH-like family protein [Salinibaculum rarum]|jgi:peroxiredoxin family protein|uniref:DsrE/DsrF/DrsH-like family protein n=1 Tax=Salinibaculum rarum TaxID=3058903 RepID=UPI00265F2A99|nr:DsrE/DsrF/DrsH-like family protein [Salinibaculum sp. KK48]
MSGYAIVVASSELERIQAVSMIGSIAASSDTPVEVFVTMNGLTAFNRDRVESGDFDVGGPVGQAMLSSEGDEMPIFTEQLAQAKELGPLSVYACSMAMDVMGTELDDYVDVFDEELGVAGFLSRARDKQVLFV